MMRRLTRPFLILLALVFLFEAWLWDRLAPIVASVVERIPLREIKGRVGAFVEHLSPPATLFVFIVPVLLLLPMKFLGLWMIANGSWLGALGVLGLAKVVSLGVTAFIFDITRPKLLQMAWFARLYDWVIRGLTWAHALTDPVKIRIELMVRRLRRWLRMFGPKRAGRTLKLLRRIRHRMQARAAAV